MCIGELPCSWLITTTQITSVTQPKIVQVHQELLKKCHNYDLYSVWTGIYYPDNVHTMGIPQNTDQNDTQHTIMHPIAATQGPTMDWTHNDGLYQWLMMWKKCPLILRCQLEAALDSCKAKLLLQWSSDHGIKIYNGWNMNCTHEDTLARYWCRRNGYCQPEANDIHVHYNLWCNMK